MPEKKLISSQDDIPPYLPKQPRLVILGTMAAINARRIEGQDPPTEPYFFYNNNRNRFWGYMWEVFENEPKPSSLSVDDKHAFCEKHGIAICNLLGEMQIQPEDAGDRTDTIIFDAYKKGRVRTKTVSSDFREALKTLPLFFTCYHKKDLGLLLNHFFEENKLNPELTDEINYLHTPAMPGRGNVLELWRTAFAKVSSPAI